MHYGKVGILLVAFLHIFQEGKKDGVGANCWKACTECIMVSTCERWSLSLAQTGLPSNSRRSQDRQQSQRRGVNSIGLPFGFQLTSVHFLPLFSQCQSDSPSQLIGRGITVRIPHNLGVGRGHWIQLPGFRYWLCLLGN